MSIKGAVANNASTSISAATKTNASTSEEREYIMKTTRAMYHPNQYPSDLICVDTVSGKSAVFEFTVDESLASKNGNFFGGFWPVLVDCLTSTVYFAHDEKSKPKDAQNPPATRAGSTEINATILRAAPIGTRVAAHAHVLQTGSTVVFAEAKFYNVPKSGEKQALLCLGRHTLVIGNPKPKPPPQAKL